MTPLEKAEDLILKYSVKVDMFCTINNKKYIPSGLPTTKSSTQLAIIAVDEIIEDYKSWRVKHYLTLEHALILCEYWKEVKLHLESYLKL